MEVLTEQDKKAILKALDDIQVLRAEIQRAKRAGLDVSQLETELQELSMKLNSLKQVYVTPTSSKPR